MDFTLVVDNQYNQPTREIPPAGITVEVLLSIRPIGPPYRGGNRRYFTEALFRETNPQGETILPVFSLHQDHEGLVNCRTTFLAERDPTGYKWAIKYLGEWGHWQRLVRLEWFAEAYSKWAEELDTLLRSEAIQKIIDESASGSKSAYQASKFLAMQEYKKSSGRGRPSKEEVSGALKQEVRVREEEAADLVRMKGLEVPNPTPPTIN